MLDGLGEVSAALLGRVRPDARRVLEVGCRDGSFAAAYKRRNPKARYVAVEPPGPEAEVARSRTDRLFEGEFDALSDAALAAEGPFDAVVLQDLSRLSDPAGGLRRLHALLAPGGALACGFENAGRWSLLAALMADAGSAESLGPPRRLLTLPAVQAAFNDAGFPWLRVRKIPDSEAPPAVLDRLAAAAAAFGASREAFLDRAGVQRFVVAAERAQNPRREPMHLCVLAMAPRLLEVRVRLPAERLDASPDFRVTYREKTVSLPPVAPSMPRIMVLQRFFVRDEEVWTKRLAEIIRDGWIVVAEYDDHPALMQELGSKPERDFAPSLSLAHAVQTSTPALAEAFAAYSPQVGLFPNAVFRLGDFRSRPADEAPRIFYGALNRERFSSRVAEALTPCLEAHREAEFVVVHDRAFFEALRTERKTFLPVMPYDRYLDVMAGCDIALTPLEGTFGERFKSDVKFLEASASGLACLASRPVYGDTIVDGETGLIVDAVGDWPAALARVLEDRSLRDRLARSAWEYVRNDRMFAYQVEARRVWYASLWERREALTRALFARHPALEGLVEDARRASLAGAT